MRLWRSGWSRWWVIGVVFKSFTRTLINAIIKLYKLYIRFLLFLKCKNNVPWFLNIYYLFDLWPNYLTYRCDIRPWPCPHIEHKLMTFMKNIYESITNQPNSNNLFICNWLLRKLFYFNTFDLPMTLTLISLPLFWTKYHALFCGSKLAQ